MSKDIDHNDVAKKLEQEFEQDIDRKTSEVASVGTDPNGNLVTPVLVRASTVQPEEVSWLWEPYIPSGKLTILQGNPGEGKTFIALSISAIVSRGWPFPGTDGKPTKSGKPGNVLFLNLEDGMEDTLRPRLDKYEADTDRIFFLPEFKKQNKQNGQETIEAITFQDIPALRAAFETVKPVLMVADPIQGFLGKVDFHRANEIRPVLSGLAKLANEFRCAVVSVSHLRKGEANKALYRGLGSIDFVATARSVLLAGRDPANPNDRAIVQIKSSLAPEGPAIGYTIDQGRLQWTGPSDLTAEKLLGPESSSKRQTALENAKDFLINRFQETDTLPQREIIAQATEAEIKERTLRRAKDELKIESYRQSSGNTGEGEWLWKFPKDAKSEEEIFGNLANCPKEFV